MESNRMQSRGFLKGKLMPFHLKPKPSPTVQYTTSKLSPASVVVVHQVQGCVISQPKPKVYNSRDPMTLEEIYSVAVDESVDMKAAKYISLVQERLKLEALNE